MATPKVSVKQNAEDIVQGTGFATKMKRTALAAGLVLVSALACAADENDAKDILNAMGGYLAGLNEFAFDYEEYHEVVTTGGERLGLASSGSVAVARPDRIRVTKNAGFTDVTLAFDGKTLAVHDAASALVARAPLSGNLDLLIDTLRDTYGRPLPAADLLVDSAHDGLMEGVTEIKDIGVGVVAGTTCDHLAFRAAEVDWQIWIAQGETPHPCMFVITTTAMEGAPQYRVMLRNWRSDNAGAEFVMETPTTATEVDMNTFLADAPAYPDNFMLEDQK